MERRSKPPLRKKRKHRIAPNSMKKWHGSWSNRATARGETATLDDIKSLAEFGDELRNFAKIIAIVGIAHDDKFPASGGYSMD